MSESILTSKSGSPGRSAVTIFITVHNDGHFLDESLGSALEVQQAMATTDGPNVDVKVFDDGSTDSRTCEVLDRVARRNIEVTRLPHRGLAATRNTALASVPTEFFVPLDADNRVRDEMLTELVPLLLDDPDAGAAYGDAMRFGDVTGRWTMGPTDETLIQSVNHIDSCALYRTAAVERIGSYRADLLGHEDWDLWLRFLDAGVGIIYSPVITFDYRVRPESLIRRLLAPIYQLAPTRHGASPVGGQLP